MNENYPTQDCSPKVCCDIETTITSKLINRKKRLEIELSETNAALKALEDHPDVCEVLTLVGKAIGRTL